MSALEPSPQGGESSTAATVKPAGRTLALARGLMYFAIAVLAYLALRRLAAVLAPVGTGLFFAYVLDPWATRLERRGVPRAGAIALLGLVNFLLVALLMFLIAPLVAREVRLFAERWHEYQTRIETTLLPWLRQLLDLPEAASATETLSRALAQLGGALRGASGDVAQWGLSAIQTATGLVRILVAVLLTPVFTIYFLKDFPRLVGEAQALIPPRHRARTVEVVGEVNHALASWLRGQLTVMLILGLLYSVGLGVAGVPLGVAIGLFTGLLAFVPYVGVLVGLLLAVGVALVDWHGDATPLLGVLATFTAVQLLDGLFITPRVLGGRVGLSPVTVIFALFLGGDLLGYPGLLLAVPAAAVAKVLLARARAAYLRSPLYDSAAAAATGAAPAVASSSDLPRADEMRVIEGGKQP